MCLITNCKRVGQIMLKKNLTRFCAIFAIIFKNSKMIQDFSVRCQEFYTLAHETQTIGHCIFFNTYRK